MAALCQPPLICVHVQVQKRTASRPGYGGAHGSDTAVGNFDRLSHRPPGRTDDFGLGDKEAAEVPYVCLTITQVFLPRFKFYTSA